MNDYNRNDQNNAYQPPQYTQQYQQPNGYQPPNYTQQPYTGQNYTAAPPTYSVPVGYPQKSRIAAALLAFLFGIFGVHNFYLGYTGKAIAQLLVTLLSCCMLFFVSGIWGVVDGILILTGKIAVDAKGNPLGE